MYGTQADDENTTVQRSFENDVKMYGTQAKEALEIMQSEFENDVKMYGTQAPGTTLTIP